ncbi:hypothetical protein GCM10009119_32100 [Algoriphagus jejuensis]|uniref:Integrase-like protein n=1 Tax=Algoriphagus jejuensis TaxID=419934 RepID=A0ABN1N313_9BACT
MKKPKINDNQGFPRDNSLMQLHHGQVMVVYTSKSDSEVWKSFKSGEESAFNFIYRKFMPALFNYGFHLCRDTNAVKDSVQSIFMDLRLKREKLPEVSNINTICSSGVRAYFLHN